VYKEQVMAACVTALFSSRTEKVKYEWKGSDFKNKFIHSFNLASPVLNRYGRN
jgi:hypothetical protein